MRLTLTLDHRDGLKPRDTRLLTGGTLSIGRAAGNDWVLADPDRTLSKTHCVISIEAGRPVLTDLSTNGVFVNGARDPTQRDSRTVLTDGDQFRLGEYTVSVAELDDSPVSRATAGQNHPFGADLGKDPLGADPLDFDPLETPFGAATPPAFQHPLPAAPPSARVADPFDMLDEQRPRTGALDDDLFHGATPLDPWQGPPQADNADAPIHAFTPAKPIAQPSPGELDFDALLGDAPPEPAGHPRQPAPAAVAPPSIPTPLNTDPAPIGDQASMQATGMMAAFLAGAGLPDLRLQSQEPQDALRAAGELLRAMVDGMRDVLMSRAAIKNEFHMEQTMLRARDNNALKFSVTSEQAIAALLQPGGPGYKPPLDAVREAFADVRSHEMAVMAGVQTALLGLLRRFDPAALEQRLQPGMLDSVLPATRRARTWELFCNTYREIAREAEDDFQSVFGREFARAYDAQTRKL